MSKKLFEKILLDMDGVIANFDDWHFRLTHEIEKPTEFLKANPLIFYGLEPYAWAHELIELLQVWTANLFICTNALTTKIADIKLSWLINHNLLETPNVIFTENKHLFANPHTILIDDYEGNVDKFRENGGEAILFPQPWNRLAKYLYYSAEVLGERNARLDYIKQRLVNSSIMRG